MTNSPDPRPGHRLDPYDAVLLVSFGGPERTEQVMPFLRRVTSGRGIPDDRLAEVAEHYYLFGGRSPINDQNRALLAAMQAELARRGLTGPELTWGNRNSEPLLDRVLPQLADRGHRRILTLTTSGYPSYSSCRQYRENLYDALQGVAPSIRAEMVVDRIRSYATHPGFVEAWIDRVREALDRLADPSARVVFVTHSIPDAMAEGAGPEGDGYRRWHRQVAWSILTGLSDRLADQARAGVDLAYCSRSGAPGQPWLEPDINDRLTTLHGSGVSAIVLVPIGFISDHLEVIYDLDTEARATADRLGLAMERARGISDHPVFVQLLVDLLEERAALARAEPVDQPVIPDGAVGRVICPAGCCPNLGQPGRGALCQTA